MHMEQSFAIFLFSAVMISLSGVLLPGPMTAVVIEHGGRSRLAGIYISLGHAVVEFPIIAVVAMGAAGVFESQALRILVGLLGGAYLLYLGGGLMKPKAIGQGGNGGGTNSSFLVGILLSAGNPAFLLWWATIGLGLVVSAMAFGTAGVVIFAIVHWLCDLVWLTFLAAASHKGIKRFGDTFYRKVSLACGAVMLFFGGMFVVNSLKLLAG